MSSSECYFSRSVLNNGLLIYCPGHGFRDVISSYDVVARLRNIRIIRTPLCSHIRARRSKLYHKILVTKENGPNDIMVQILSTILSLSLSLFVPILDDRGSRCDASCGDSFDKAG